MPRRKRADDARGGEQRIVKRVAAGAAAAADDGELSSEPWRVGHGTRRLHFVRGHAASSQTRLRAGLDSECCRTAVRV